MANIKPKKRTMHIYTFADGTQIEVLKYSASELRWQEKEHGKCVKVDTRVSIW